ncbi:MAG TPA: Fe-S cluster protein [Spirochaeta sp.]|nr:Fe-S cluster protein [Spirochaeta sp.]
MRNIIKKFKFIIAAVVLYACFFFLRQDIFWAAVNYTKDFMLEMLQVLPPVLVITALMAVWVPAEAIKKGLGSASGLRGKLLSLLIGSVSAGPIYAAFPAAYMLFKKGASVSNLVIILSSWAVIKVPMLLVEMKFLSIRFMIIRLILTVPAILLMGVLMERLIKRSNIQSADDKDAIIELPNINCGACGYNNCKDFKKAVLNKDKTLEDCVFLKKADNRTGVTV